MEDLFIIIINGNLSMLSRNIFSIRIISRNMLNIYFSIGDHNFPFKNKIARIIDVHLWIINFDFNLELARIVITIELKTHIIMHTVMTDQKVFDLSLSFLFLDLLFHSLDPFKRMSLKVSFRSKSLFHPLVMFFS